MHHSLFSVEVRPKLVAHGVTVCRWEDGFVRCHDVSSLTRQLWTLANAHRNGVQSLSAYVPAGAGAAGGGGSLRFFVSGGGDGAVRVWRLDNREMITQVSSRSLDE